MVGEIDDEWKSEWFVLKYKGWGPGPVDFDNESPVK